MVGLGRSKLLLLFLLPHISQASDGCHGEYGKYGYFYWRCGDVCTRQKEQCFCGNSRYGFYEEKWCCATNCTGGCLQWNEGYKEGDHPNNCAEWQPANCTNGVALKLTESCGQSHTCNYHGQDGGRERSYVAACANTSICVKEGEQVTTTNYNQTICTGDSSCAGEQEWCREEGRKEEECPHGFIRCPGIGSNKGGCNVTKSIPGQCFEYSKARDGKENNCLDRSDEDPFQEAGTARNKETTIDFGSLKGCTNEDGKPGLECGGQSYGELGNSINCNPMYGWCTVGLSWECPVLGEGIRTDDRTLCANISFWRQFSCGEDWIRCQAGNSGQCVHQEVWGVEGKFGSCHDGSDLYRLIKQPTEVWRSEPVTEEDYIENYKGIDEGATYVEDTTTGLWMVAVSEATCQASKGFVCKVRLCTGCFFYPPLPP